MGAALFALSFPPFDLWPLVFVAPAALAFAAIDESSTRRVLIAVFVSQFVMWLWLVHWIIPVTGVGYPFLALYMSIWPTLFAWIVRRIARHPKMNRWPNALMVPLLWTGIEFFRGDVLFHGYPWYLLAHPLIAAPVLLQTADLFGTYFISFTAAVVSGLIIDLIRARSRRSPTTAFPSSRLFISSTVVVSLYAVTLAYGLWRLNQSGTLSAGPRILAIQTNLPQDNKIGWSPEEQSRDVPGFMALTREALAKVSPPPDVIVWPETMVPGIGFEAQTNVKLQDLRDRLGWDLSHLLIWPREVEDFQRQIQIPMIVGSESWIAPQETQQNNRLILQPRANYNSAYLINGEPPHQRYDKFFLTPFGETMPYISAWPWLEHLFLRIGVGADLAFNLDSNPDVKLLPLNVRNTGRDVLIATPICFEDTVARFVRRMVHTKGEKLADVIVNISNDGWFNTSDGDRKLHAMTAQFRAIENRVPMVRCANTGVSVWIDSTGRVRGAAGAGTYGPPRQSGYLVAEVQLDSRRTLYGRIGEMMPILCLVATIVAALVTLKRR